MKIKTDKENIILIPEDDMDIFELGSLSGKIPMDYIFHIRGEDSNVLEKVSFRIEHLLVLLKKCKM